MDDTSQFPAIVLFTGVAFLCAAAVIVRRGRTQGVPTPRRIRLMAKLARSAASAPPSRWIVVSATAGVFAFLGSLLIGLAVTILIVRAIPPDVPNPAEAYEGFGDAMMAMMYFGIGAVVSLCVAMIVGVVAGGSVAASYCGGDSPSLNSDDSGHSSRV